MFELLLATRNQGKITELRDLLSDLPLRLLTVDDVEGLPEVVEDKATLEGNASKKARVLHERSGLPTLADDTGLEVRSLDGRPGVHSARFAGPQATDEENRRHLLEQLQGEADRRARFRTVLAFAEDGHIDCVEGICRGTIIDEERGEGGFGYDALFVPEGTTKTFAELSPEEKNAISHRSRALQQFAEFLRERLP